MSLKELAEYIGMSPWTIRARLRTGDFPLSPVRLGRLLKFDIQQVDAYIDSLSAK